jgi:KaiC/GvpD/RAD55 family RecA-like ATPase
MERSASEQWINDLKIAIVEDNHDNIYNLVMEMPEFEKFEQLEQAHAMVQSSIEMFIKERNSAKRNMMNIEKMKQFLINNKKSGLDIKS